MTNPVDPREALRTILQEYGVNDLHSWRCAYPEIYGKCSCVDDLITAILASYRPAHEVEDMREAYESWRRDGQEMHAALLNIWHMVEPGDTKHMTYGLNPHAVTESVKKALSPVSPVTETPEEPK